MKKAIVSSRAVATPIAGFPVAMVPDPAQGIAKQVLSSNHVIQGPLSNYELATRAGDYTFPISNRC